MHELDLLAMAVAAFDRRLKLVRAEQCAHSTPCRNWTVHDLVKHVIAGNTLATSLLIPDAPTSQDVDPSDVVSEFEGSVASQDDAFDGVDPNVEVVHPAGRVTVREFAVCRSGDIAVHAWDCPGS